MLGVSGKGKFLTGEEGAQIFPWPQTVGVTSVIARVEPTIGGIDVGDIVAGIEAGTAWSVMWAEVAVDTVL